MSSLYILTLRRYYTALYCFLLSLTDWHCVQLCKYSPSYFELILLPTVAPSRCKRLWVPITASSAIFETIFMLVLYMYDVELSRIINWTIITSSKSSINEQELQYLNAEEESKRLEVQYVICFKMAKDLFYFNLLSCLFIRLLCSSVICISFACAFVYW